MPQIKNAMLLNPDTGRPFTYPEPLLDDDGEPISESPGGSPVVQTRSWTLFQFVLRTLGAQDARTAQWTDLERYHRVARRIRRELQSDRPVDGQAVKLNSDDHRWLCDTARKLWPTLAGKDIAVEASLALGLMGNDDEEECED